MHRMIEQPPPQTCPEDQGATGNLPSGSNSRPDRFDGKPLITYTVALAALATAVLLRWLLDPLLSDTLPLITLFGAIAIAVRIGGYRPALLVGALGYLACSYMFIPPRGLFVHREPAVLAGLFLYVATAFIIIGLGEALRRSHRKCLAAEADARQQAELLGTTLFSIGDGVIATDTDGRVISMNAVAQKLTGWKNEEAAGMPLTKVFQIVNETTRLEVENPALRALKEGVVVGLANHTILMAKDGSERPIDDSAAPIRRDEGEVVGSVLVFRDISERHQAEVENRDARQQLMTMIESVTDGFMRYDRDWRIVYVNAQAERINRLTRSEMLGKNVWELFPALVGTRFEMEFRRAVEERVTVEFENHYAPFGRWYALKGYPTADGGLTTFIRDITGRKRSEALLAGQKRVLEMVATDAPLTEVLAALAGVIEEQEPGLLCSVILLDETGSRLRVGAGPSMPEGYLLLLNGLPIDPPYLGPCGMALDTGEAVVVEDIETDSRWSDGWRDQALAYGLKSCRTVPIIGSEGKPVATFAVYRQRKGDPSPSDSNLLAVATHLAGIVIDRNKQQSALRESEARYRAIGESIDYGIWVCDAEGRNTYASESFLRLVGMTQQQCSDFGWTSKLHPEDAAATVKAWNECVRKQGNWDRQHRFIGMDGEWHEIVARGVPLKNDAGVLLGWAGINLDVSRLLRAEREVIRLAEESDRQRRLYETVLTNTPDLAYVFDLDHRFKYANYALLTMWGRTWEEAIGRNCIELGYEHWHADLHEREIDQIAATKQPIRGEVAFTGTNGKRFYDYILVPVIGADGEVEAVAGTTRDVTERKESEERQAFLVSLADTLRPLSDPVEVQAEASRILGEYLRANRVVYFEICGDDYIIERDYTRDVQPLAGRYPVAAFGRALLAKLVDGCTIVEADATCQSDRSADGQAAFAAIQVRGHVDVPLVKDGRFVAGMTVHVSDRRDWTVQEVAIIEETAERTWAAVERVRAEAALHQSEERRRLALDAAELGAWHIDPATHAFTSDERFRLIFSGTTDEMDYEQAFAVVHPDDRDRIRHAIDAVILSESPAPYAEEYRVVHQDGSIRWVFAKGRANQERDGMGRIVSFDGTIADVTTRKLIEEERECLVGQLRDADRRKDEFLATLAHELRNPLAPIRNGLEVMRLAGAEGPVERARTMMERQLTQLVRLVDDLLDVSRVTSGKFELRRDLVELRAVVDAAAETSRPAFDLAGHVLEIDVPDDPILVDGDATRLAQIVSNLLTNSAKYTHPAGRVRLAVRREGSVAVLIVADNGTGIPPDMLGRIFEMFTQVDRALEKTTGGLGIGLSLVKGLVEMHDGTIEARSQGEGRGSEFIVRLPVAERADQTAAAAAVVEPCKAARCRILVTDDNLDSAESLGMFLDLLGHEVSTANDGLQALELAERFRPEVILLDIGMPKLNGYEACRRIRETPWGKNAVLIAMTGWGQAEDKRRSLEAGFDHHLVKPVDPGALVKLLAPHNS